MIAFAANDASPPGLIPLRFNSTFGETAGRRAFCCYRWFRVC